MAYQMLQKLVANTVSIGIVNYFDLPQKLRLENQFLNYVKDGSLLAVSEDGVSWFFQDRSPLLLEGRWLDFVDKSISNGALFMLVDMAGLDERLYNFVNGISPMPSYVNQNMTFAILMSAFTTIRDMWEVSPNPAIVALNHPTHWVMGYASSAY